MPEETPKVEIYQTRLFEKVFNRLTDDDKNQVDLEVGVIEETPEIGTLKKGDLSHLRVHKFKLNGREVLLGYSWIEQKLELYLLSLGPHENFYQSAKNRRQADLNFMS